MLTGLESVSEKAQVELIGTAIGRPLRWHEIDRAQAQSEFNITGLLIDAWVDFLSHPELVTCEVGQLLGRPALSFAEWAPTGLSSWCTRND